MADWPDPEHDAYVRGFRHGFVATLWLSVCAFGVGTLIYTLA